MKSRREEESDGFDAVLANARVLPEIEAEVRRETEVRVCLYS